MNFELRKKIILSKNGKHLIDFPEDFPLVTRLVEIQYNYQLTPNYHDYLELLYILKGAGQFLIGDKKYDIQHDDIFMIGNLEIHTLDADINNPIKMMGIFFLPKLIFNPGSNLIDYYYLKPFYSNICRYRPGVEMKNTLNKKIYSLIEKIINSVDKKPEYYKITVKTYLCDLLYKFLIQTNNKYNASSIFNKKSKELSRLHSVFEYSQKYFNKQISLKEISNVACMSTYHFCHFFKNVTGHTYTDYIMRIRIDKAIEYIRIGILSLSEIAYKVGFENYTYFYRIFKKLTYLSPNEYVLKNNSE